MLYNLVILCNSYFQVILNHLNLWIRRFLIVSIYKANNKPPKDY